jgi:hypothetical protein
MFYMHNGFTVAFSFFINIILIFYWPWQDRWIERWLHSEMLLSLSVLVIETSALAHETTTIIHLWSMLSTNHAALIACEPPHICQRGHSYKLYHSNPCNNKKKSLRWSFIWKIIFIKNKFIKIFINVMKNLLSSSLVGGIIWSIFFMLWRVCGNSCKCFFAWKYIKILEASSLCFWGGVVIVASVFQSEIH